MYNHVRKGQNDMTYQEAKNKALMTNRNVNSCDEYKDGYHFYQERKEEWFGDSGFVIIKSTGRVLRWIDFIFQFHPERKANILDFATGEVKGELNYENEDGEEDEEE